MAIGDFDMAPAFERRKHHEEIGGADLALKSDLASDGPDKRGCGRSNSISGSSACKFGPDCHKHSYKVG
jgi:hypothetical protein